MNNIESNLVGTLCKLCDKKKIKNLTSLGIHLARSHNDNDMSTTDYIIKFQYNGIVPKCKCGCGSPVKIKKKGAGFCDYIQGHWMRDNFDLYNTDEIKSKIKETNIKKYGGPSPVSSEAVREKIKKTCLERHGSEYSWKIESVINKRKQVFCERKAEIDDKRGKTNLRKYGAINVFGSNEIKDKIKKTTLERYGVDCVLKLSRVKERAKATNHTEEAEIKRVKTLQKKYGVSNAFLISHSNEISSRKGFHFSQKMKIRLEYRSLWELGYFEWLDDNVNVKAYFYEELKIPYIYKNHKRNYIPDILVEYFDGRKVLFEIKPRYLRNSEINQCKFAAAREFCKQNNIKFKVLTEKYLRYIGVL